MQKTLIIMFLIISFVFCSTVHCENAVYLHTNKDYKYSISHPSNFIIVDADSIDEMCVSNKISRPRRVMLSAMEELGWDKELVLVMNGQHLFVTIREYSSIMDISYQQYLDSMRNNNDKNYNTKFQNGIFKQIIFMASSLSYLLLKKAKKFVMLTIH